MMLHLAEHPGNTQYAAAVHFEDLFPAMSRIALQKLSEPVNAESEAFASLEQLDPLDPYLKQD
jgi:hypothetical protein